MSQFGEELRKERVSRGVALETISEKTKVVTRYLCALEEEHFELLPGGILSKGIVRGYARSCGLDESTWVERFLAASHQQENGDGWTQFAQNVGRSRPHGGEWGRLRRRWTRMVLLLLVLAGIGWDLSQHLNTRVVAEASQPHAVSATTAVSPAINSSAP